MLVLTRNLGQSLSIGEEIEVTVTRVDGDRVKIGIEAPREVTIKREEIVGTACRRLEPTAASKEDGDSQGPRIQYRKRRRQLSEHQDRTE